MNKLLSAAAALLLVANFAGAQPSGTPPSNNSIATPSGVDSAECEAKAIGKEGKPLTGNAKTAFMKRCAAENRGGGASDSCDKKALSKEGKPMAGATMDAISKECKEAPTRK